ncbi:MAG: pyruvate kinase [Alphaproteobacteria bacterium]|jgi:pyruvate kinase|nr:pyruvate kinase [Alphaproteobacteria bacterium]MDP7487399.1 pyruvate kinase [Alphaproteobacteria bacterium]HJM60694.1 pyruvate kinase [Alphaproteobacteria bacterium]
MSRTKIVATIGPATNSADALLSLSRAGMSVARLNGSHADLDWHAETIRLIRKTLPETPILLDIPGRKIRTVQLAHEPSFAAGETIVLTTDTGYDGSEKVPVNYAYLHEDISPGTTVLADDGTLSFTVDAVDGQDIHCRAEAAGTLKSRKGINVPSVALRTALVTDRDCKMMAFVRAHGVDFVGISFVESAAHVEAVRELAGGDWPRIVSKIENQGGIDNLDEVIAASDAVMIDRGDLSVETGLETVGIFQKRILESGTSHAKPVIVATEMLHTMIGNPFPTKAEVSDISNAVLDGAAATMLSGETAVGAHATEAVGVMRRVADAAETHLHGPDGCAPSKPGDVPHAMSEAVLLLSRSLPVTKIVTVTISGFAARSIAARRPGQPILAVSNDAMAARSFNLLPGTSGIHVDIPFTRTSTDHIPSCLAALWQRGLIDDSDFILVTAVAYPDSGNRMNMLETHAVADLSRSLGWQAP